MKAFKVTVKIQTLVGVETRVIELSAKSIESMNKQVVMKMGNRDYSIVLVQEIQPDQFTEICGVVK